MSEAAGSWMVELRRRLVSPPPRRLGASDLRRAAVLVPLYVDAGNLWTILTRRSDELPHHRGQIAFPGGAQEAGEVPWDAALRETGEELGVDPERILRIGELDETETPTGFRIVPCVGAVPFPLETRVDSGEIAEVFSVPVVAFGDVRAVEDRTVTVDGVSRAYRIYHVAHRQIWGLTARIVQNLMQRLGFEFPADGEEPWGPGA